MGGHPFPKTSCKICSKPVDLTVDLTSDEDGKAVHEHCYVDRLLAGKWRDIDLAL